MENKRKHARNRIKFERKIYRLTTLVTLRSVSKQKHKSIREKKNLRARYVRIINETRSERKERGGNRFRDRLGWLMIQDKNSGKSQVTQASSLSQRLITQDYTSLSWLFADE